MQFNEFASVVSKQFSRMSLGRQRLYVSSLSGEDLYQTYLDAFPKGTDPLFKVRTEHDCTACRHFIRNVGGVVALAEGWGGFLITTVWDGAAELPGHYGVVASRLQSLLRSREVRGLFCVSPRKSRFGVSVTQTKTPESDRVTSWHHFDSGVIPATHCAAEPSAVRAKHASAMALFARALNEIPPSALTTILELIDGDHLYRGAEHRRAVDLFATAQRRYDMLRPLYKKLFTRLHAHDDVAHFRNSVIGTLAVDLADGTPLADAVTKFEAKVAPANYKRPKALVTESMVRAAMKTITALGLEPALQRRLATIDDISVSDVLWVDGSVRPQMKGGLEGDLLAHVKKAAPAKISDQISDLTYDAFMSRLPDATSVEIMFNPLHAGNLMVLSAPQEKGFAQLFSWDNDFAWSYRGGLTDSVLRQQVAARGGRVDGALRFSHMWNHEARNSSLMDLHVFLPGCSERFANNGSNEDYPSGRRVGWNRRKDALSGGVQDVYYTAEAPPDYVPVENITFPDLSRLPEGKYIFRIHNWRFRDPTHGGFRAEIEAGGELFVYDHPEPLRDKEWVTLAVATLKNGGFTFGHRHPVGSAPKTIWGLTTGQFARVKTILHSPNFWNGQTKGNKHTFFVMEGCAADEPMRGIYNEFLHPRLNEHRKVFELISAKTQCQPIEGHLAGLGFSSTKRDTFVVRMRSSAGLRTYNVQI